MSDRSVIDDFADWPEPVRDHLQRGYGDPVQVDRLGGMSLARVYRARFGGISLIVKASPSTKETFFYERAAGPLGQAGVPTPRLEWSAHLPGGCWLILEDIPDPLPIRWDHYQPDLRMVAVLCRLHAATFEAPTELPDLYTPRWTNSMTRAALSIFPAKVASQLAPDLLAIEGETQHLFEPRCWISGDPNPTNWGVRRDGTPVLYDWERFGRGTPALDLAIAVAGLGDESAYIDIAAIYVGQWERVNGTCPWPLEVLSRDIGLAKVWSVVEFMSHHTISAANIPKETLDRLVGIVPHWLGSVRRAVLLP